MPALSTPVTTHSSSRSSRGAGMPPSSGRKNTVSRFSHSSRLQPADRRRSTSAPCPESNSSTANSEPRIVRGVGLERLAEDMHHRDDRRGIVLREAERRAGGADLGVVAREEPAPEPQIAGPDLGLEDTHGPEVEEADPRVMAHEVVAG